MTVFTIVIVAWLAASAGFVAGMWVGSRIRRGREDDSE